MSEPLQPIDTQSEPVNLDETPISPTDAQTRNKLEKSLQGRPDRKDLVDKNILKDTTASPALQGKQAELERARLQDKLDQALQHRPKPEELVQQGILTKDEAPAV